MRLFRNSRKAIKKWHSRAMLVDLHKTRITISEPKKKHVPPWIFKRLTPLGQEKPSIVIPKPQ